MFNIENDNEYIEIVNQILNNSEFNKMNDIEHHGTTRMEHSLKVSYYAYKCAKKLHLNYVETARGGLLHDFFISDNDRTDMQRLKDTFTHPKKAVETASQIFDLSEREKDIIKSHMFPFYTSVPKYIESWLVNATDKVVGGYELFKQYKFSFKSAVNYLYLFIFLNIIK